MRALLTSTGIVLTLTLVATISIEICELICEKGPFLLKHLKNIQLLCTQPYTFNRCLLNDVSVNR